MALTEYKKKLWRYRSRVILLSSLVGGIFSLLITRFITGQAEWNEMLINSLFGMVMGAVVSSGIQLMDGLLLRHIKKLPFILNLILVPLVLSGLVSLIYMLFFTLFIGIEEAGKIHFLSETVLFSLIITFIINLSSAISGLLGQKVFIRLIFGTYRKPIQEERFVMFLDIVGSTTIAEAIGDIAFLSLLKDFFEDLTEPILETKAEIYKYVGDEVILTWKKQSGIYKENVLRLVPLFKQQLKKRESYYQKKYGLLPDFRAGLHFGPLIIGEMGNLKREIALLGDTMNTTARIQGACGDYQEDFLLSETVKDFFKMSISTEEWQSLGEIALKGKNIKVSLFSLSEKDNTVY